MQKGKIHLFVCLFVCLWMQRETVVSSHHIPRLPHSGLGWWDSCRSRGRSIGLTKTTSHPPLPPAAEVSRSPLFSSIKPVVSLPKRCVEWVGARVSGEANECAMRAHIHMCPRTHPPTYRGCLCACVRACVCMCVCVVTSIRETRAARAKVHMRVSE